MMPLVPPSFPFRQSVTHSSVSPNFPKNFGSKEISMESSPRSEEIKNQMFVKFNKYLKRTGFKAFERRKKKKLKNVENRSLEELVGNVNEKLVGKRSFHDFEGKKESGVKIGGEGGKFVLSFSKAVFGKGGLERK